MADACAHGFDAGFVTLDYAKVAVLGIVQGITEMLPISSTAHMRVVPALLGWQGPGSSFSAAMQLAALAAVVSLFLERRGAAYYRLAVRGCARGFHRRSRHKERRSFWREPCMTSCLPSATRVRNRARTIDLMPESRKGESRVVTVRRARAASAFDPYQQPVIVVCLALQHEAAF